MLTRKLNPITGDIETSGETFIDKREAVAQTIKTRLGLFLGECFRDYTDGTPWFQQILGKQKSRSSAIALIKQRIINTENVVSIRSFASSFDLQARKMTITAQVLTVYGLVEITTNKGV